MEERAGQIPQLAWKALDRTNLQDSVCCRQMRSDRWPQPQHCLSKESDAAISTAASNLLTDHSTYLQYGLAMRDRRAKCPREEVSSKSRQLPARRGACKGSIPHMGRLLKQLFQWSINGWREKAAEPNTSTEKPLRNRKLGGQIKSFMNNEVSAFVKVLLFKSGFPTLYFTNYI